MTKSVKLSWKNRSQGSGLHQEIYRKLDNGSESLVATVPVDINTYTDPIPPEIDNVEYRLTTVATHKAVEYRSDSLNLLVSIFKPMLAVPSKATLNIESVSPLLIDWGDGVVQTIETSTVTTLGILSKRYTHTYSGSYGDKIISIRHADKNSQIEYFTSDGLKEIKQWYGPGYKQSPTGAILGLTDLTFNGFGPELTHVPETAPLNTTNFAYMFKNATVFNGNIANWDVSKVTNMSNMFRGATAFNGNVSGWNTSKVTNMDSMFFGASVFNQDIGAWNTSKVINMVNMFYGAKAFNQDISAWNTSKVTNMSYMFRGATAFNGNVSGWDVSKVTSMDSMFYNARAFNQDIGAWNTSKVTNMSNMFDGAKSFNQDLSQWCVGLISALPNRFTSYLTPITAEKYPVWGTCPRGENQV